jgi:hypothetical protein
MLLRNIGWPSPNYMVLYPRRQYSSKSKSRLNVIKILSKFVEFFSGWKHGDKQTQPSRMNTIWSQL